MKRRQEPTARRGGVAPLCVFARRSRCGTISGLSPVGLRFRQMVTPGGYTMSVAMTNCSALEIGTTDRHGYCYAVRDTCDDKPGLRCRYRLPAYIGQAAIAAGYTSFQRTPA